MISIIIDAIITLAGAIFAYYVIFTPSGKAQLQHFITNYVGGAIAVAAPLVGSLSASLDSIVKAFITAFSTNGPNLLADMEKPLADVAKAGFEHVTHNLVGKGHIDPAHWQASAAEAMADAAGFGLASFGVTALFESLFPEKLNTLNGIGPMLATLAGFEEVTHAALGPLMKAAIGTPATFDSQAKMRPNLPGDGEIRQLYARRLLTIQQAERLMAYHGLQNDHIRHLLDGAFRPVSPFVLSRLADGPDWDEAAMRELLAYAGHRPKDIDLLIKAFEAQSLRAFRQQLLTAAEASFEKGMLSEKELDDILKDLNISADAVKLIKQTAGIKRHDHVLSEHIAAETEAAKNGVIPVAQYRINLIRLGLGTPEVGALVDQVNAHNAATEISAERRAAQTLLRQERQLFVTDWLLAFKAGDINEAEFTAGLLALGFPLTITLEYLALAEFRKKAHPAPKKKAPK